MDVFDLRKTIVDRYAEYVESFLRIADDRIRKEVVREYQGGRLWPEPLVQLNPSFEKGRNVDELVEEGLIDQRTARVFRDRAGNPFHLYRHQEAAVRAATRCESYVLTTGTGSGKSLAYILPIVDAVLREPRPGRVSAILTYPMNALVNSQVEELEKFLGKKGESGVRFRRYTGQESREEKREVQENPPDIILTNYMMLEYILTRESDQPLVDAAQHLRYLVLDELHTYRGRQGADVALLIRRLRDRLDAGSMQCIGTSATIAGPGSLTEQKEAVAGLARSMFGTDVPTENVIVESLIRLTDKTVYNDRTVDAIILRVRGDIGVPGSVEEWKRDPLSSWIEDTFGLQESPGDPGSPYRRATPIPIEGEGGAAQRLADLCGGNESVDVCAQIVQQWLMVGNHLVSPENPDRSFLPFRIHQFIAKGDTVYATLGSRADRFITLEAQLRAPIEPAEGDEEAPVLFPLSFCRECGHEFYTVNRIAAEESVSYVGRELGMRVGQSDEEKTSGFLYQDEERPWSDVEEDIASRVPDDWITATGRLSRSAKKYMPRPVSVCPSGIEAERGLPFHFFPSFRFCPHCEVTYSQWQTNEYGVLATLTSEGRSTATTIIGTTAIEALHNIAGLDASARKLLSFTDNRQDASLQAGHFNDFVTVSAIRAAMYRALAERGNDSGISHEELIDGVVRVLDPVWTKAWKASADREETISGERLFDLGVRRMVGYRVFRDQSRGWRVTQPNLEQCGLLRIEYDGLEATSTAVRWFPESPDWLNIEKAALFLDLPSDVKRQICIDFLDFLRRELAVGTQYLDPAKLQDWTYQSRKVLNDPWALPPYDYIEKSVYAVPSENTGQDKLLRYITPRGGFALYLKRILRGKLGREVETEEIHTAICGLFEVMVQGGLLARIDGSGRGRKDSERLDRYQVNAEIMRWIPGDGEQGFHDPIRVPQQAVSEGRKDHSTNRFFVGLYRNHALKVATFEAREHTAQISYGDREDREKDFREAKLPVLFCSPTMELGVDIASLNLVHMRNVPPTPANYAQRSGRAGRGGDAALVITYCTSGSPHDQYYFARPQEMVAGAVSMPKFDLRNPALVRSHIHALWLSASGLDLGMIPAHVVDINDRVNLPLKKEIASAITPLAAREVVRKKALKLLSSLPGERIGGLSHEEFVDRALRELPKRFEEAFDRWRRLFRSTIEQRDLHRDRSDDSSLSKTERRNAGRFARDAQARWEALIDASSGMMSDFYIYRYLASEGFIPGYSFPRLPLTAFIGSREGRDRSETLTRPRFLALTEFGPRNAIYHNGSQYSVTRAVLDGRGEDGDVRTDHVKICQQCATLHHQTPTQNYDLCVNCGIELKSERTNLWPQVDSIASPRTRITSDEEERMKFGYELRVAYALPVKREQRCEGQLNAPLPGDRRIEGVLTYGENSDIWRMNIRWRRSREKAEGFLLDAISGTWSKRDSAEENLGDPEEEEMKRPQRVIPYVREQSNALILSLVLPESSDLRDEKLTHQELVSLDAALLKAITLHFQLEEREVESELIPHESPDRILLYETTQGGAGVLRLLVVDAEALAEIARKALELCHFNERDDWSDMGRAPHAHQDCGGACYHCLLSYGNQPSHFYLDRFAIRDILIGLTQGRVEVEDGDTSQRDEMPSEIALPSLSTRLMALGYNRPTSELLGLRGMPREPDCWYERGRWLLFLDGNHPDANEVEWFEDRGYRSLRLPAAESDWCPLLESIAEVVGTPIPAFGVDRFEWDLFPDEWHQILEPVYHRGFDVEPGGDYAEDGRVIGSWVATVRSGESAYMIVDSRMPEAEGVVAAAGRSGAGAIALNPETSEAADRLLDALTKEADA